MFLRVNRSKRRLQRLRARIRNLIRKRTVRMGNLKVNRFKRSKLSQVGTGLQIEGLRGERRGPWEG